MLLYRSYLQLAALCITLFAAFVWFLSASSGPDAFQDRVSGKYIRYGRGGRTAAPSTNSKPILEIDEPASDPIWDIQNRTLGFQKIYAISMPHRFDKMDYLALMALVTDLDITFVNGVNGSEIHPKALPSYWKGTVAMGDYGCWRAHLDVYQHMAQNRIQTALIFEDDVDWDVLIRHQMTEFARGVRSLQNATLPLHSPYGDDWDLLAVGHTGVNNKPNREQKYWVSHNDPTVIAESRRIWTRKPDFSTEKLSGEHTRVVLEVNKLTGAAAYAMSLRGAARILYDQSMLPNAQAIDVAQSALCRRDVYGLSFCHGVYPMLFGRYRAIGPRDKDSDRRAQSNEAEPGTYKEKFGERLEPESEFTVFPTSINIGRLMKGEHVIPAYDPETDLMKQIDIRKVQLPRGREVFVSPTEYKEYQAHVAESKQTQAKETEQQQAEVHDKEAGEQGEQVELKKDEEGATEAETEAILKRRRRRYAH